jgi:hypothetical protein
MTISENIHIIFFFHIWECCWVKHFLQLLICFALQIQHDQILNAQQKWQITNAPKFV